MPPKPPKLTTAIVRAYLKKCPQILAAEILGVLPETVGERLKSGAWTRIGKSSVDLFEAADLERKRLRSGPVSFEAARLKKAQAEKAEIANQVARGELIPMSEASEIISGFASTIAQYLDALGDRLGPTLAAEAEPILVIDALKRETQDLGTELAGFASSLEALSPHSRHRPAPSDAPARPVGRRKSPVSRRKRGSRPVSK